MRFIIHFLLLYLFVHSNYVNGSQDFYEIKNDPLLRKCQRLPLRIQTNYGGKLIC